MADTISTRKTSYILLALYLVPVTIAPYMALSLASAALIVFVAHSRCPVKTLHRLENTIKATEEINERAKLKLECMNSHVELMNNASRLFRAKLSASKIQTKIFASRKKSGNKYLQEIRRIMQDTEKCIKEVREIQTATLLTIEAERQRRLSENVKKSREALDAILSPTRHAHLVHRFGSGANSEQEYDM